VKNCFMIFGGHSAQLTTHQRKRERERCTRQSPPPHYSSIGSRKPSHLAEMTTRSTSRTRDTTHLSSTLSLAMLTH
jgi:hypothetical protein